MNDNNIPSLHNAVVHSAPLDEVLLRRLYNAIWIPSIEESNKATNEIMLSMSEELYSQYVKALDDKTQDELARKGAKEAMAMIKEMNTAITSISDNPMYNVHERFLKEIDKVPYFLQYLHAQGISSQEIRRAMRFLLTVLKRNTKSFVMPKLLKEKSRKNKLKLFALDEKTSTYFPFMTEGINTFYNFDINTLSEADKKLVEKTKLFYEQYLEPLRQDIYEVYKKD